MKALLIALSLAFVTACDSERPSVLTGPTPVPPPPIVPPAPMPPRETGPVRMNPMPLSPDANVDVTVRHDDPHCFVNWDSTGVCRQFEVTMSTDGTLVATVMHPVPDRGLWNPEVFIAAPNGDWNPPEYAATANRVSMQAKAGLTYLVVVISYGPFPDVLRLSVDVRP
jgi:hypothetical protein